MDVCRRTFTEGLASTEKSEDNLELGLKVGSYQHERIFIAFVN